MIKGDHGPTKLLHIDLFYNIYIRVLFGNTNINGGKYALENCQYGIKVLPGSIVTIQLQAYNNLSNLGLQ